MLTLNSLRIPHVSALPLLVAVGACGQTSSDSDNRSGDDQSNGGTVSESDADRSDSGGGEGGTEQATGGGPGELEWTVPNCETTVVGDLTVLEISVSTGNRPRCDHVVPLEAPGEMLALCDAKLHASTDSGCTWQQLDEEMIHEDLVAAPGGGAYGVGHVPGDFTKHVLGIDIGEGVESRSILDEGVARLIVHPDDPESLTVVGSRAVHHSSDGARSWAPALTLPTADMARVVAHDVAAPERFLISDWDKVYVTEDAGETYVESSFVFEGNSYGDVYASRLIAADADPTVIYAELVHIHEGPSTDFGQGYYVSSDGGVTFEVGPVELEGTLSPDPNDAGTLLAFRVNSGGSAPGATWPTDADFLRIDASGNEVIGTWPLPILSFARSPADPNFLYLGPRPSNFW